MTSDEGVPMFAEFSGFLVHVACVWCSRINRRVLLQKPLDIVRREAVFFLDNVHGALQLADHIPIRHELDQFKLYHIRGARLIPTLRCSDGTPVIVINQSIHWLHFFLQTNALKKPEFLMDPIISHCLGWFKKPRNSSFNLVMAIWVRNRRSLLIDFLRGISQAGWWLKKTFWKKTVNWDASPIPIGCMPYMVTWIPLIYPQC